MNTDMEENFLRNKIPIQLSGTVFPKQKHLVGFKNRRGVIMTLMTLNDIYVF